MRRAVSVALAVAGLAGTVFAGLALADPVQDPGEIRDTRYTPSPKYGAAKGFGWRQFAGDVFPGAEEQARELGYDPKDSPVPKTVDFYTVDFRNDDNGLAAGSICEDPGAASDEQLKACRRVPIVYRYARWEGSTQPAEWREVYRGTDHGYVGAIAWVNARKAVAVGGDGCYPRRETLTPRDLEAQCGPNAKQAQQENRLPGRQEMIAGDARVWVFENDQWDDISDTLPEQMTGLTAVDFSTRPADCRAGSECGFAGGLGQVWVWKDERFQTPVESNGLSRLSKYLHASTSVDCDDAAKADGDECVPSHRDFPFRVRELSFFPPGTLPNATPAVVGATAGCCYVNPATGSVDDPNARLDPRVNFPRIMRLTPGSAPTWRAEAAVKFLSGFAGLDSDHPAPKAGLLADSLYSIDWVQTWDNGKCVSFVAAPGGPEPEPGATPAVEPTSRVLSCGGTSTPQGLVRDGQFSGPGLSDPLSQWYEVSSVRLAAGGDGESTHAPNILQKIEPVAAGFGSGTGGDIDSTKGDSLIDWAVGELRATHQAAAYTTTTKTYGLDAPYPLNCPEDAGSSVTPGLPDISAQCKADPDFADQLNSNNIIMLPSYALNAYAAISESGNAWAAGDRGALLKRSGADTDAGNLGGSDVAPKLGGGDVTRLSDRSAYDAFRPISSDDPGVVPPLSDQPVDQLPVGRVAAAGSANPHPDAIREESVRAFAVSRDGSEAWALGPASLDSIFALPTLYHFDGTRWSRCDPDGIRGVLAADAACQSLRSVTGLEQDRQRARILALTRVPTENGDDPSRAGDFEALAIARLPGAHNEAVLRYRDGRWSVDREWSGQLSEVNTDFVDLALGTPDEGWLVANTNSFGGPSMFRLSGGRWTQCNNGTGAPNVPHIQSVCLDRDLILPITANDGAGASAGARGLRLTTAGKRVYLYGARKLGNTSDQSGPRLPVILVDDTGRTGTDRKWRREYDPKNDCGGCVQGAIHSLSIAVGEDGSYTGWAVGAFGPRAVPSPTLVNSNPDNEDLTPLLRRAPDPEACSKGSCWEPLTNPGTAAKEYLLPHTVNQPVTPGGTAAEIVSLPGRSGSGMVVAVGNVERMTHPIVWRDPQSARWEVLSTPFSMSEGGNVLHQARVTALAPDSRGGLWMAAEPQAGATGTWFYRYTRQVQKPVFSDVAHPVREPITAATAGGDGSFWVATESGTVYRYDRVTGWDRVALKGWDSGGVVQSPAHALAVGRDGEGIVVGRQGRIGVIGPREVGLDRVSVLCSANRANCATTRTLRAAAVAPDGSALAGGDNRALVGRAPGGAFRAVNAPQVAASTTITALSMPSPARAWLATSTGDVFVGSLVGGDWHWVRENVDADGDSLSRTASGDVLRLRAIAVNEDGRGYAVGDHGLILERSGDGERPWRRIGGYSDHFHSVALGPNGRGALVGGDGGQVLTLVNGRFEVARHNDYFDPASVSTLPATMGRVLGVALLPGFEPGQVEAWAATQSPVTQTGGRLPPPGNISHYTNAPEDPLLDPRAERARPLPDAPARVEGELDLAAFGKSDCQFGPNDVCPELTGALLANELVAGRVRDELTSESGRPDLAVFTGGANDVGGSRSRDIASLPVPASLMHERWWEIVGESFGRAGVPLFGALGGQDLSHTRACDPVTARTNCAGTKSAEQKVGLNVAWRQALVGAPAPWGRGKVRSESGLTFRPVDSLSVSMDATPVGGARTHYAVDVRRDGKKVLRLVVLDSSLKTFSGVAGLQNPVREQLAWLDDVLSERSGREAGQAAVVVSETPSYAYNNSAGATTDTLVESAAFETLLVKNRVTAVISGRLGWNGLYWLMAPGLHTPCPGGSYEPDPPTDPTKLCQGSGDGPAGNADRIASELEHGLGHPVPRPSKVFQDVAGQLANIPVVIAASAGGKFGPSGRGSGTGAQGFWRGYTRVRLFPGRDLVPVIEQRPVFDWIGLQAPDHTIRPGRRMTLRGYGREPLSIDQPARYVDIDGPAITHRYDLVLADPDKPYLPKVDPASENPHGYVPLPEDIGASIDRQTGVVRYTGRGNRPPVYAVAVLSVGKMVATTPLVFAPRRSFRAPPPPRPARIVLPPPPAVRGTAPAAIPPTPPTNIPKPPNLNLTFPPAPTLPSLSLNAPQASPPPPPAPPPPPVSPAASALQLTTAPVGLQVAPAATVIPPPAPPIQPAPPGGARREARQRQAAAAKSEEGADKQAEAGGENTSAATRHDQPRDLAFTAQQRPDQTSAWTRGALYGGGLGVAAITLALGWNLMRPGPRRRAPELPAPAWARTTRRRP